MGISDVPLCGRFDVFCQIARRAAKGSTVYGEWAQNNIIQVRFNLTPSMVVSSDETVSRKAQYFRDPRRYETYLEANHFLPSINNERAEERNATYARNLAELNKLVLVMFTEDTTVVPKESAWFGSEAPPQDERMVQLSPQETLSQKDVPEREIIPMRLQPLYVNDWIGLKQLDLRGDVLLETCEGEHMQLAHCWKPLVSKYAGGPL